jgi:hypothetical protein
MSIPPIIADVAEVREQLSTGAGMTSPANAALACGQL